jgi:hypothetical protein
MNTKTFNTWSPLFSGFYNTIWDRSDQWLNYELDDEDCFRKRYSELATLPWDFINEHFWDCVRGQSGNLAVAKAALRALPKVLPHGMVTATEFEELRSPREYNFTNDAVNCKITVDLDVLKTYLIEHKIELDKYLEYNYTSYDGFFSSYPNDFKQWDAATNGWVDLDGHYCGALLKFVALNEDDNAEMNLFECSDVFEEYLNNVHVDTKYLINKYEIRNKSK